MKMAAQPIFFSAQPLTISCAVNLFFCAGIFFRCAAILEAEGYKGKCYLWGLFKQAVS